MDNTWVDIMANPVRAPRIGHANVVRAIQKVKDAKMLRHDPDALRAPSRNRFGVKEAVHNTFGHVALYERANEAFLRRNLPKLRQDLDCDKKTRVRALNSIVDVLHDPERVPEAVREKIPQKLVQLMVDLDPQVRERSVAAMAILAVTPLGQEALFSTPNMFYRLKALLMDERQTVRFCAGRTLRTLLLSHNGNRRCVDELNLALYLFSILVKEIDPCIVKDHLYSLKLLLRLESTKEKCIEEGAFEVLNGLIYWKDKEVAAGALEVLSELAECRAGERKAEARSFLSSLALRKHLRSPDPRLCKAAVCFIMHITHSTEAKAEALKYGILDRVYHFALEKEDPMCQRMAFQVLRNLMLYPPCQKRLEELLKNSYVVLRGSEAD